MRNATLADLENVLISSELLDDLGKHYIDIENKAKDRARSLGKLRDDLFESEKDSLKALTHAFQCILEKNVPKKFNPVSVKISDPKWEVHFMEFREGPFIFYFRLSEDKWVYDRTCKSDI